LSAADLAILSTLEETLPPSGFVALNDDRDTFEIADIVVVFRKEFLSRFPEVGDFISNLSPRLTESVVKGLISRIQLSGLAPKVVAREFMLDQGLLVE